MQALEKRTKKSEPVTRRRVADFKTPVEVREAVNPRRGSGVSGVPEGQTHRHAALAFVRDFPVEGRPLTAKQFDEWADTHGYLVVPNNVEKKSDAWLAHLQRRHYLRHNICKASTHPEIRAMGGQAFTIELAPGGVWEVRSPQHAMLSDKLANSLERLTIRKAKKYAVLLQSADWNALTPALQHAVEDQYRCLRDMKKRVATEIEILDDRQKEIESGIRRAIESGEIKPRNHGIALMLAEDTGGDDVIERQEDDDATGNV